jgi:hypothetical protein
MMRTLKLNKGAAALLFEQAALFADYKECLASKSALWIHKGVGSEVEE